MINRNMTHDQLKAELVKSYFEQLDSRSWTKLILIATAFVVAYMFWWSVPRELVLCWLLAVVSVSLIERRMNAYIVRHRHQEHLHKRFLNQLTVIILMQAVFWGASAVFIWLGENPLYDILAATVLVTIVATVAIQSAACLRIFYIWIGVGFTPVVVVFVMHDSHVHNISIVLMLLFITVTMLTTKLANSRVVQLIMLRMELAQQKTYAEAANLSKSKFLAAASHDLRQPLHALTLFVGVLQERCKNTDLRLLANNIRNSAESIEDLLNALLDVSKLDAGVVKPEEHTVDIYQLLVKLEDEYTVIASEKGLKFSVNPISCFVSTDASLLETVIRNLLSNAIRYTEQGEVRLECAVVNGEVKLDVADTGSGIPIDQQKAVFQEFYQLDNRNSGQVKGLGLGLSIVNRLVQLLDISIYLESEPGKGSVFSLVLPLIEEGFNVECDEKVQNQQAYDLTGMKVLIIDDEPMIREAMAALLSVWGGVAVVAASGAEAISLLKQQQIIPDMLIVDYQLQNGELGIDSAQAVLALCGKDIPILVITGSTDKGRQLNLQSQGYVVMYKPLQSEKLLGFIQDVREEMLPAAGKKSVRPLTSVKERLI